MRRLLFFLLFILSVTLGALLTRAGQARDVYHSICELVEIHFYRDDHSLKDWVSDCHRRAAVLPMYTRPEVLLADVQDLMNKMGVSHFQIYSPAEDRQLWKGESIDPGLRSRYVEDAAHLWDSALTRPRVRLVHSAPAASSRAVAPRTTRVRRHRQRHRRSV